MSNVEFVTSQYTNLRSGYFASVRVKGLGWAILALEAKLQLGYFSFSAKMACGYFASRGKIATAVS